jgi:hypothetical protein
MRRFACLFSALLALALIPSHHAYTQYPVCGLGDYAWYIEVANQTSGERFFYPTDVIGRLGDKNRNAACAFCPVPGIVKVTNPYAIAYCSGFSTPEMYRCPASNSTDIDGGYCPWSEWSACPSCGPAQAVRSRVCSCPPKQGCGLSCDRLGPSIMHQDCDIPHCPINGGFTPWETYACTATCTADGIAFERRSCTNPAPALGGLPCSGPMYRDGDRCTFPIDCGISDAPKETNGILESVILILSLHLFVSLYGCK